MLKKIQAFLASVLAFVLAPVAAYAETYLVMWANHKGSEGVVHIGTSAIAELRSWELSVEGATIDDTTLSDTYETHQNGLSSWGGSASAFWDETDTNGQEAIDIGTKVTLKMYPEGSSSSDTYYVGTASPTRITRRVAGLNAMVEVDFEFKGDGTLSQTTV